MSPLPPPLPPDDEGGARTDPASSGLPRPVPRLPVPRPPPPAFKEGGGGTTAVDPKAPLTPRALDPDRSVAELIPGGGGTTAVDPKRPAGIPLGPGGSGVALKTGCGGTTFSAASVPNPP